METPFSTQLPTKQILLQLAMTQPICMLLRGLPLDPHVFQSFTPCRLDTCLILVQWTCTQFLVDTRKLLIGSFHRLTLRLSLSLLWLLAFWKPSVRCSRNKRNPGIYSNISCWQWFHFISSSKISFIPCQDHALAPYFALSWKFFHCLIMLLFLVVQKAQIFGWKGW